jgi:hypothetical protein
MPEPESLHIPDLTKFGMQCVAHMKLLDDGTTIQTTFVPSQEMVSYHLCNCVR